MDALVPIHRLDEHRRWVNKRLREASSQLDLEQLHRSLPIGQGSVWKTMTHLVAAEYVWLATLKGDSAPTLPGDDPAKLPGNQEGDGAFSTLAELNLFWTKLEQDWESYLQSLTNSALNDWVEKRVRSSTSGQILQTRRVDILLHVCTHAQYTTAQLINMLRQLGHDNLPDVMLITMARAESNES